jgi:hypothetical protein
MSNENSRKLNQSRLNQADLLALDYAGKVELLERVIQELLDLRLEFAQISGKAAELRANIEVLKQVKSALQSAIRAEGIS